MAAVTARVHKKVLSKQSVAKRKRLRDQAKAREGRYGAVGGVVLLAGSVLCLLALATFDPRDRPGRHYHNSVGPVGHWVAASLQAWLGLCAYALPLCGLFAAWVLFTGSKWPRRWPQLVAG